MLKKQFRDTYCSKKNCTQKYHSDCVTRGTDISCYTVLLVEARKISCDCLHTNKAGVSELPAAYRLWHHPPPSMAGRQRRSYLY